ncbi:MAG: ParM/StbA family protein [Anaerolineaceae bacterium]|nr:ParM/StbA family protein [Anaerolineaceae bacterium]
MTSIERFNIGLDIGTFAIKLTDKNGKSLQIGQVATPGNFHVSNMMGMNNSNTPTMITLQNSNSFFIGEGSHNAGRPIENLDMERFNGTPEMEALTYGVFTQHIDTYGTLPIPLSVSVGLPLQMLTAEIVAETVENVKHWLSGEHQWKADGKAYQINIRSVKVTSQPVGGLFDFLLDNNGLFIPARRSVYENEIGTITIGMNTLELLVSRKKEVLQRFTLGSTVGVRRLLELVNGQRLYSLGELDNLLRAGKLDISAAQPIWERELMGEIERAWGNSWKRFSKVLIMGGGAILLRNTLPYRFGDKALIPADPIFSVASGLWKLGIRQERRR